ncbi:MAG: hypothetical protein IPO08_22770 [Xanthomonadales bacterium]|nr:hypothetical protein [Xanthomonadales bacterium]
MTEHNLWLARLRQLELLADLLLELGKVYDLEYVSLLEAQGQASAAAAHWGWYAGDRLQGIVIDHFCFLFDEAGVTQLAGCAADDGPTVVIYHPNARLTQQTMLTKHPPVLDDGVTPEMLAGFKALFDKYLATRADWYDERAALSGFDAWFKLMVVNRLKGT